MKQIPTQVYQVIQQKLEYMNKTGTMFFQHQKNWDEDRALILLEHYHIIKPHPDYKNNYIPTKNFKKAHLMGFEKYRKEIDGELNPGMFKRNWEYLSNNSLISGMLGGIISYLLIKINDLPGINTISRRKCWCRTPNNVSKF